MSNKFKNIIIIVLMLLLIIFGVTTFILLAKNKEKELSLTGEVLISDTNYIILKSNDDDYLINNIKGTYNVGDKIKVSYKEKDLDKKNNPYDLKITDEELIEVAQIKKEDNASNNSPDNTNDKENVSNNVTNNINKSNPNLNNSNNMEPTNSDTEIISYFNNLDNEFKSGNIKDSLKSGFVTVVDFLFYNGKIKGHTFNELSNSAKLKVLSLALYFDSKIDVYFPGYKESISQNVNKVYTNVKEKIVAAYLTITTNICSNNVSLCEEAKTNFATLKTNFGLTWSLIKDIAGDGLTNLKNWYEIWRE